MVEMRWLAAIAFVAACGRQQGEPPKQEHTRLEGEIAHHVRRLRTTDDALRVGPRAASVYRREACDDAVRDDGAGGDVAAGFDVPGARPPAPLTIGEATVEISKLDPAL